MAMVVGTATFSVNSGTGVITSTGSGAAGAIFAGMIAAGTNPPITFPVAGTTTAPYSPTRPANATDVANALVGINAYANALAVQSNGIAAIVTYIQANGVAHVTNQSLGLTPSPNNANTAIQPPSSPVNIPIT